MEAKKGFNCGDCGQFIEDPNQHHPHECCVSFKAGAEAERAKLSKIPDEKLVEIIKILLKAFRELEYIDSTSYQAGVNAENNVNIIANKILSHLTAALNARKEEAINNRPKIVCLCGSTRFTNEMMLLTWEFALKGIIALGWYILPTNHKPDGSEIDHHLAEKEGVADILDGLHLRKIDLADEVFVVNVGGYIGEGTRREIDYAIKTGKPVSYLEALKGVTDGK